MEYKVDATGMKLGRLASKVAILLMGKNEPSFRKNAYPKNAVRIINLNKIDITERKLSQITHTSYSGYPGGIKKESGKHVKDTKGYGDLLKHAVSRMLPKNKHRSTMLKNLMINE